MKIQISLSTDTDLKILSVTRMRKYPVITVKFTPLQVYEHSKTYDDLRKAVLPIADKYGKYLPKDSRLTMMGKKFTDRGFEFEFKTNTPAEILDAAEKDFSKLVGTVFKARGYR